jgi:integral membrane protein (TIGR01906 family)
MMNGKLRPRLIQWLLVLSLPVVLLVADMRIVTSHWFVRWEYNRAGFNPDAFGLSTAERTYMAEVCVDYLATNAPLALLADLRLPDSRPAFNARELRHMADVQAVYNRLTLAGIVAALILLGGTAALLTTDRVHKPAARRRAAGALLGGSLLTLGLLGIVGVIMLLSWGEFFTTFHGIFFADGTWTFDYSDTLIRLFPMRFWMDVATTIVSLLIIEAIIISGMGWTRIRSIETDSA